MGWSLENQEEILSSLTALTSDSAADGALLYHPSQQRPLRWLQILRSQFVQVNLYTDGSASCLEDQLRLGREEEIQSRSNGNHRYTFLERRSFQAGIDSADVTTFDAFPPPSPLEASGSDLSSPPGKVAPDFSTEKESTPPQPVMLQARRGRGRPRRQAFHVPQEVTAMEPKRNFRTRKNAESALENSWANLSKAPLLTPLSPEKPRQTRAPQKPQQPVNLTPLPSLPSYAFH